VVISQSRGAFGLVILLAFALFLLVKLSIKIKTIGLSLLTIFLIFIVFIRPAAIIEKQITNQKNNDINFELLKSYLMKYDLTASQQCNGFIKSEDTLKIKISWSTKNKSYTYEANSEKDEYQKWFLNKNLNFGKYTINIKERTINDKTFKTILVNDMNSVGNEAVVSSVLIPGSGIKKATYSKESGKAQLWGVLIPLSISAVTFLASTSSYDKYLKDPSDQNYQNANNLNKASIIFEGWGIFNYFKQIFKTVRIVNSNKLDRRKLNNLIQEEKNMILKEELSLN
jgi:hypothetical protein